MPELKILRPSEAAKLLLEDILKDEDKSAIAADVVQRTKELSLRDSADPDYTIGNLVLNQVYDTPLEGMTEMQEAFKTKLYVPLGFVMCNEESSEEDMNDDYMSFWTQSMFLIQYVGRLSRAVFLDGLTLDEACKIYLTITESSGYMKARAEDPVTMTTKDNSDVVRAALHELNASGSGSMYSDGEETASCQTRVIETGETGREEGKE